MAKKKKNEKREVIYSKVKVEPHDTDATALTVEESKEIIGWEVTEDKSKAVITDLEGNMIKLGNNLRNRPLYLKTNVERIIEELLGGHWEFNGETIIIGKTGLVLNGQHSLVGHILAEQKRAIYYAEDKDNQWVRFWGDRPVTMKKMVVYGVEETDKVVNTMDTCKPRSLTDVIYRSSYFEGLDEKTRRTVSNMTENAIKILWYRTGWTDNQMVKQRTHAEMLDFLDRHKKLLECVQHIYEENQSEAIKDPIGRYIGPGMAAGILYMMASSSSDGDEYRHMDPPSEMKSKMKPQLDWTNWDKACEFWTLLASGGDDEKTGFDVLRKSLSKLQNADYKAPLIFTISTLAKAWEAFLKDERITPGMIKLKTIEKEGIPVPILVDREIDFGGIDMGDSTVSKKADAVEEARKASKGKAKKAKGEAEETEEEESEQEETLVVGDSIVEEHDVEEEQAVTEVEESEVTEEVEEESVSDEPNEEEIARRAAEIKEENERKRLDKAEKDLEKAEAKKAKARKGNGKAVKDDVQEEEEDEPSDKLAKARKQRSRKKKVVEEEIIEEVIQEEEQEPEEVESDEEITNFSDDMDSMGDAEDEYEEGSDEDTMEHVSDDSSDAPAPCIRHR